MECFPGVTPTFEAPIAAALKARDNFDEGLGRGLLAQLKQEVRDKHALLVADTKEEEDVQDFYYAGGDAAVSKLCEEKLLKIWM